MEASGVVLKRPICFSSSCYSAPSSNELKATVFMGRRRVLSSGFCDQGHLQYYSSNSGVSSSIVSGSTKEKELKKMKKKKKQLKLLKGLTKDLSTFSQMGFGLDSDRAALVDQIKGNMISEAAELLLEQLQKLKAEEKELKRKMKEEKVRLKAAQMLNRCEMSSSSSSESSDSECGEVVHMKNLKKTQPVQDSVPLLIEEKTSSSQPQADDKTTVPLMISTNPESKCCSRLDTTNCSKKIEVCMGGKCKRSGAAAILEEFQRVVGIEGSVSGCKCMGKCRDGPNVKVLNGVADENNSNSLCIGVGLEDVNTIVANFLGENQNQNQLGFAAAT